MTVRWRRAARLLTRVAAALVVLLLVASLALRLWARHRYQDASRAFVADFGERVEVPTLDRPQGGTWLRAAALIVQLSPEEMGTIHSWVRTTEPLTAEEARWARALLERERLPRELLERAARSERIDLFLGPPERLEVERMAGLTKPNELGALVKLLVAEELERRAHGDFSGACESLEQLGSLARGIRKGRFFFEQMLASLPESTLLHRLQAALSAGAPLPCLDSLGTILEGLDPIDATRRALVEEARLQLLPHRFRVLPSEAMDGASHLLSMAFFEQGNSLVRAYVLDAARDLLTERDTTTQPIEGPRRRADRDLAGSLRDTFRGQLQNGELADARRRLALASLRVRGAIQAGETERIEAWIDREPSVPLTGTRVAVRADTGGAWLLDLPGSDPIAERFHLARERDELLRWRVLASESGAH